MVKKDKPIKPQQDYLHRGSRTIMIIKKKQKNKSNEKETSPGTTSGFEMGTINGSKRHEQQNQQRQQ
jgi:hypothetical protein